MIEDTLIFDAKAKLLPEDDYENDDQTRKRKRSESDSISFQYKPIELTPEKYAEYAKRYEVVVVNDFDDEYTMTEEERERKFKYYRIFSHVKNVKKKYSKLGEFVKVFRLYMDCLFAVAEDNWVYPKGVFIKKVLAGKIKVVGIRFPKYKGKNAKRINWDVVAEYIMDRSLDPMQLERQFEVNEEWDFNRNESDEEMIARLFSEEDLKAIDEFVERDMKGDYDDIPIVDEDEAPDGVVFEASKKMTKQLLKAYPGMLYELSDVAKQSRKERERDKRRKQTYLWGMEEDDFYKIAKIDAERSYVSTSDIPKFEGDILNDDDYERYLASLSTYTREQIKLDYNGKRRTVEEIQEIELKNDLERAGWNVKVLYGAKDKEKRLKDARKKKRKQEERMKSRLLVTAKRDKNGKITDIEFDAKRKKKKKKDKKKKKKNKEHD